MRLRANWCMESPGGHCEASAVCDQEQTKRSFPYGIPLGALHRRVVSSPAHEEATYQRPPQLCGGGVPCWIRSQPLRDLHQVVRIEHRCRNLCCFERVRSALAFRDRLSRGWASGNWGRTSVRGYIRSQLFQPAHLRTIRW